MLKYLDKVRVTTGFYEGLKGRVIYRSSKSTYDVEILSHPIKRLPSIRKVISVVGTYLEKIEEE